MGVAIANESGRARVDWVAESPTCEAGQFLQTAVRMSIDPGWHTYWLNPGDGGMKTTIQWKLPPGWTAGDLGYPAPKRFATGDLVSFGYEGTVLFPVVLAAPPDFAGTARIGATVSWLACNDGACVPGETELFLEIKAGPVARSADAGIITAAKGLIPANRNNDFKLEVAETDRMLVLEIHPRRADSPDLVGNIAFPASPDVIQTASEIRFRRVSGSCSWYATVEKSEYLTESLRGLDLVVVVPGNQASADHLRQPISLAWRKCH